MADLDYVESIVLLNFLFVCFFFFIWKKIYAHFSCFVICSVWVDNDYILIFGWTYPSHEHQQGSELQL